MRALIAQAVQRGGLPAEDLVGLLLPLFQAVHAVHDTGRVAPLRGLTALKQSDEGPIVVDHSGVTAPQLNRAAIEAAERQTSAALDVTRGATLERDFGAEARVVHGQDVSADSPGMRIVAGWQRWEHLVGHHDELTDIGSLGELLAALACGLDLTSEHDAGLLAEHARNLFALNPNVDPVIASIAAAMIAPDRRRRAQDLGELALRFQTYRDQPEDFDLDRVVLQAAGAADRRGLVLAHLRDRLFDVSRRNPLLHFRRTQRSLNLTEASVPLVLDVRNVRAEQLFTWGGPVSGRLLAGKAVDVGSIVRWEDAPYAAISLDALISAARRDRAEYGQDQLRLVPAFLRWHDLKNDPGTEIISPLVLAPVQLSKQRGVRDAYRLELVDTEAEVNPVLRHQLRELYGFELPATIDLADATSLDGLRESIERQARATQPGLSVRLGDKPRIELVRHRALTALQSYRRRRSADRPVFGRRQYAYSYVRPNWAPLGIQIYRDRVVRTPIPLAAELGDAPVPRQSVAPEEVIERDMFALRGDGDTNPYAWEVDLCAVTLANFNYRTLSLVRDYDALAAQPRPNPAFDEMFSTAPREAAAVGAPLTVADRYLVVPADGSQLGALAQARSADNFVIQGPPGTGKSQTITNLIADYVARGKRVLFVCQKRAALDVVHARLRAQGLGEVCTLVHDSQADKKAFVHGLRDTYEAWLAEPEPLTAVEARRDALVADLSAVLTEIATYETALRDGAVLAHIEQLVALREHRWGADLPPALRRLIPAPAGWAAARATVAAAADALTRAGSPPVLATSPVARIEAALLAEPHADAVIADRAGTATAALDAVLAMFGPESALSLVDAEVIAQLHALITPLARHGFAAALDPNSPAAAQVHAAAARTRAVRDAANAAEQAAAGWTQPLAADDARAGLAVARAKEGSALRLFSGPWRQVRKLVRASFDSSGRQVPPTVTQSLELLVARYDAQDALAADRLQAEQATGHPDADALATALDAARRETGVRATWRDRFAGSDGSAAALDGLASRVASARAALTGLVTNVDGLQLPAVRAALDWLAGDAGQKLVRTVGPSLVELAAHPEVAAAVRTLPATPQQLDYAVAGSAVQQARATHPVLDRLRGDHLDLLLARADTAAKALRTANADVLTARLRDRFSAGIAHSQRSATGMSPEERERKKVWTAGRRELEHEFGKVRAYKSIRQLSSAEPGAVVAALRPVWLMSPSSLSDTLPIDTDFDVVVFDEASQIPVEEAVPALYRGAQVIVVGDRMQLPPTQYFQTRATAGDADDEPDDEDAVRLGVVLDADSFLAVGSVRLPSTTLTWHYRSRSEALIQFSNAAFYEGRLATIPDRMPPALRSERLEFAVGQQPDPADVERAVDGLLERSISWMRLSDGIYAQRSNVAEAVWIAHLLREVLRRETGMTLGVVAFSEAQQAEIERALERLSTNDADFARRYEAELNREEDGQAVGLFVKNLENVQGDERDVILMSVCYAAGPDGRMRMNFGPINNAGGEKRLNVIFSRSKQHMVLVSSIDHTAITNVYNDGANTLRNFLRYAEAVSHGDASSASGILAGLGERSAGTADTRSALVDALAEALRARGLDVALDVGQSGFRCDLAVRAAGSTTYDIGVLVDSTARLNRFPLEERRTTQPAALRSAGWQVVQVLATDWDAEPDTVVERITAALPK